MIARDNTPSPARHPTDAQICAYIGGMAEELGRLARTPGLRTLRYLIDMVRLEAERQSKGPGNGSDPSTALPRTDRALKHH